MVQCSYRNKVHAGTLIEKQHPSIVRARGVADQPKGKTPASSVGWITFILVSTDRPDILRSHNDEVHSALNSQLLCILSDLPWWFPSPSSFWGWCKAPAQVIAPCALVTNCVQLSTPWTVARPAPLCDFPGKHSGVGCHALLYGIFLTQGLNLGLLHCKRILYRWATRAARTCFLRWLQWYKVPETLS